MVGHVKILILETERALETIQPNCILKLNKGTERETDLPEVTQLVNGKDENPLVYPPLLLAILYCLRLTLPHTEMRRTPCGRSVEDPQLSLNSFSLI